MADQQPNYSKIKLFAHPVHPMLVSFPVSLYTVTMVCFIVYRNNVDPFWFKAGYAANLAGICMATLAAIPGFIDWLAIPAEKRARRIGAGHMLLNVLALVLFAANYFMIKDEWNDPSPDLKYSLLLTITGFIATMGAGILGWAMVQKYHVGVLPHAENYTEPYRDPARTTYNERDTPITFTPAKDKNHHRPGTRGSSEL